MDRHARLIRPNPLIECGVSSAKTLDIKNERDDAQSITFMDSTELTKWGCDHFFRSVLHLRRQGYFCTASFSPRAGRHLINHSTRRLRRGLT